MRAITGLWALLAAIGCLLPLGGFVRSVIVLVFTTSITLGVFDAIPELWRPGASQYETNPEWVQLVADSVAQEVTVAGDTAEIRTAPVPSPRRRSLMRPCRSNLWAKAQPAKALGW